MSKCTTELRQRVRWRVAVVAMLWFLVAFVICDSAAASGGAATQFPVTATAITAGPGGNLWYVGGGQAGRLTPSGSATPLYPGVGGITSAPDGAVWFGQPGGVARLAGDGTLEQFTLPATYLTCLADGSVRGATLATDSSGNLWYSDSLDHIGRVTPTGEMISFDAGCVIGLTRGPDGNIWFTAAGAKIGKITPSGAITTFSVPSGDNAAAITSGPDGNLWFTEPAASRIGRITPAGAITEFPLSGALSSPAAITSGPDGNLWFTEYTGLLLPIGSTPAPHIGRITTSGTVNQSAGPFGTEITSGPDGNLWVATGTAVWRLPPVLLAESVSPPVVSGALQQGQTLAATRGTWTNSPVSYTYQWQRCQTASTDSCITIGTASGQTYQLDRVDVGYRMRVQEQAITAGDGISAAVASAMTEPVQALPAPVTIGPPSISGRPLEGSSLTEIHGRWRNGPITEYRLQWIRCDASGRRCAAITRATLNHYLLTAADVGRRIRVSETAINTGGGSAPATSDATAIVVPVPRITRLVLLPRNFRALRNAPSVIRSARSGTRVSYSLNLSIGVRVTATRVSRGWQTGRRCVIAPVPGRRRCALVTPVKGSFTVRGHRGTNSFRFSGRIGGTTLKPGNYRLTATPSMGAGAGKSKTADFTILR